MKMFVYLGVRARRPRDEIRARKEPKTGISPANRGRAGAPERNVDRGVSYNVSRATELCTRRPRLRSGVGRSPTCTRRTEPRSCSSSSRSTKRGSPKRGSPNPCSERSRAYRVLAPRGLVAVAFHVGTDTVHVDELFSCATSLDVMLHRPEAVAGDFIDAGFVIEARLDREPYPGAEHPTQRSYLVARKR